ncbi:geranylgeranyl diphosphate synthase, type II [Belliella buryatensis]|jgi:geranylgeranyl diphosphate synthase, type II|uniref:Geranylgeranyl diphosphate synthase, type II n=1 Tax=Belliella buryatensis TaxID=1500549 RepID=A0A239GPT8_9BACT|nr:polyprenyl synthetase family protein [Belliella buryatensis]SNS71236.1 geranylgeranyl diphosphate synthase, type II [Belliella buryatensis]
MNQTTENLSVDKLLADLENHIQRHHYGASPNELYEPISYIMSLGGKRIRPLLALMAYSLYKDNYQDILSPAAAVEVFHNFTLMHDDIMDDAPLRRGQATVHEKWNANTAILSGDVMLVKAYDMLLDISSDKLPVALSLFNQTAAEVCEGQQHDMNFERMDHVTDEAYIDMIRQKTAVLLGFSLQLGGLLADATPEEVQKLYDFGVNIGIGFQLKDDLLDVYADKAKFGKQVGGDIIANKKTYLLIKAKELATGSQREQLESWLAKTAFDKEEKVKAVTAIYDQLGIKALTEAKMHEYFQEGFEQFKSLKVPNRANFEILLKLTEDLVNREK